MEVRDFLHKGLKRLYLNDDTALLPAEVVDKLRKMLAFLESIDDVEELRSVPTWKIHTLSGDRKGVWSLHVTKNWRLTFRIDTQAPGGAICDIDYEDYH